MYSDQNVQQMEIHTTRNVREFKTQFSLQPKKPHVWLQKLCFWILTKLGAYHQETTYVTQFHPLTTDSVLEHIRKSMGVVVELDESPQTVYMGNSEWEDLYQTVAQDYSMRLDYELSIGQPFNTFLGLHVVRIPWMKGVLVVPDKYKQHISVHNR